MLENSRSENRPRRVVLLVLLLATGSLLLALHIPRAVEMLAQRAGEFATSGLQGMRNMVLGPPSVGLQIGHLDAASHPDELARLRVSTGGYGGGIHEVKVTQAVARELAARLQSRGVEAIILPATIPPGFRADAFVSLHADSSADPWRRGYKSAVFRHERNRWDASFKRYIDEIYLAGSGLPDDDANVSGDMLEYYAFNRRFRHSLARSTPAVIVELGYLSHPQDRQLLEQTDRVAELLGQGIIEFLEARGRMPTE